MRQTKLRMPIKSTNWLLETLQEITKLRNELGLNDKPGTHRYRGWSEAAARRGSLQRWVRMLQYLSSKKGEA